MCGEKKSFANSIEMELGSPPHVRGKVEWVNTNMTDIRITPACAGKSRGRYCLGDKGRDHPRMCGEKTKKIP